MNLKKKSNLKTKSISNNIIKSKFKPQIIVTVFLENKANNI